MIYKPSKMTAVIHRLQAKSQTILCMGYRIIKSNAILFQLFERQSPRYACKIAIG